MHFCFSKPGILKQFIADLHSGKLHREFHHGPDPTEAPADQVSALMYSYMKVIGYVGKSACDFEKFIN